LLHIFLLLLKRINALTAIVYVKKLFQLSAYIFIFFYGTLKSIHCIAEKEKICIYVWKQSIHSTYNEISPVTSVWLFTFTTASHAVSKRRRKRNGKVSKAKQLNM